MSDIKVAVVGLGVMGRNHARVLSDLPGVAFVGASDPNEASRTAMRLMPNVKLYADHLQLLDVEKPDAVVIAAPSELHAKIAVDVMDRGVHVLVEKPIAKSVEDAKAIIAGAKKNNVKLMVGHIERFNPAVQETKRRVAANELGTVFQLHARRLSPFPSRIQDVGVILDLATHDIDAMFYITGAKSVVRAHAETARKAHKSCEDLLSGLLRFDTGQIGMLDVSWLSPKKMRELWVVGEGGTFMADYLSQDVYWYKNGHINDTWAPASHFSGAVEGDMVKLHMPKREPLRMELEAFVKMLRGEIESPVTGEEALTNVEVALRLIESGLEGRALAK
jgi:UDP-N-acetylglucosamine 3-dehydrogenase